MRPVFFDDAAYAAERTGTMSTPSDPISLPLRVIGRIATDFPAKFGIPRQSGLVPSLRGIVTLDEPYRNPDALRGLEGFSHIWLLWLFSESIRADFSPTVRPPRLGGNVRMGVFATRSPFRPSPIGLSAVKLERIEDGRLYVSGVDLLDGTPILDIKPYLPHADCIPDATGGFADRLRDYELTVDFPRQLLEKLPPDRREAALGVLAGDPRPSYQSDPERVYGMAFAGFEIRFTVEGNRLRVITVNPA